MAIYQHFNLQFRLSPEDEGDYEWFDYHHSASCDQDKIDHKRDIAITEDFFLIAKYQNSNPVKASMGLDESDFLEILGLTKLVSVEE